MSSHVAPHRWADALAGTIAARDIATMESHAASCERCARVRGRVQRASQSFPALRQQSAPELGWDTVRARVHWAVSSEKRARGATVRAPRSRLVPVLAVGALVAGVSLIAVSTDRDPPPPPRTEPVAAPVRAVAAPTALGAVVVREVGDHTMINGLVRRRIFDEVLGKGTVIATGKSRLDVQFDTESGLQIGPSSSATFERLDSERIEIALTEGTVDVVVTRRAPEQRFVVRAGSRTVEVRGTRFRVSHTEDALLVTCAHGKVVVRDASGEVEVPASREIELAPSAAVLASGVVALTPAHAADLEQATPHVLPVWTTPTQLVQTSAPLEVATAANRDVRVDGVEVGQGPLRLRVMPGRHTVEAADTAGRFRRAGWVDVKAGAAARLDVQTEVAAPTGGVAARKRQLHAGIDRARLANCTRAIAKAGVTDTYVRIEMSVDESGAVQFLNVIDTDLPSTTSGCVRDVLADVQFKRGAAATFNEKLEL